MICRSHCWFIRLLRQCLQSWNVISCVVFASKAPKRILHQLLHGICHIMKNLSRGGTALLTIKPTFSDFLTIQSRLLSPSNTHSSPSTSTGSGRRRSLWKPSRAYGPSAATTADKACPPTPTATLSCSGNSMLVYATGFCCPSVWCSPAPFSSVPFFCSTLGLLAL